jgi:hypothetical protein
MEHQFTTVILDIVAQYFGESGTDVFERSPLLQYLNIKTASVTRGSKARSSFANLYAVYVLVEDYVRKGFHERDDYSKYEGAKFSDLFRRQRELAFGGKLQNHALNHRLNEEFRRHFPRVDFVPILREVETKRYWINDNLLKIRVGRRVFNIAEAVLAVIDAYVEAKRRAFDSFIRTCEQLRSLSEKDEKGAISFVSGLLAPNVDARVFEITSYAILKHYYHNQIVYFGFSPDELEDSPLLLFKTGRCNANDGGIDFVMKPLGRFFQVTETLDVRKYFLDIDKIERYPISFVIKSEASVAELTAKLREGARKQYAVEAIVEKYMSCVEEVINIPILKERLRASVEEGRIAAILQEIIHQSRVEFNYEENE